MTAATVDAGMGDIAKDYGIVKRIQVLEDLKSKVSQAVCVCVRPDLDSVSLHADFYRCDCVVAENKCKYVHYKYDQVRHKFVSECRAKPPPSYLLSLPSH